MTEAQAAVEATTAHGDAFRFRERLTEMFQKSPLPQADLMFNLGLYIRSSLLVKFIILYELYGRFKSLPGALIEFGTWWGQNLVLLENLRAIHEPFISATMLDIERFTRMASMLRGSERLQGEVALYGNDKR